MADVYNVYTADGDDSALTSTVEEEAVRVVWDERPTETQRVYKELKRAILANSYRPGEALQEVRIAAEYGSSRTPVREAFHKLEADGLLTIVPRRGAFVQQPTVRDFLDINELRLILEPVASRHATSSLSDAAIADLQHRLEGIVRENPTETDIKSLELLDGELHVAIADSLANIRMRTIIRGLNDMMQIVREQDMRRRHAELHGSIGEILAAFAARDPDLAEDIMRRHIADFSGALRNLG